MKQVRQFGWVILLFAVPLLLFSACSKSDKDKDGDPGHDGTYSGTILGTSGQIGTWSMTVQNGNASGNFTVSSQTHEFNGKVKDSKIAFQVSPEPGYVIDVELIFSGDQVLGSWKDSEGDVGGIEGTKTGGGGGGGSGAAYDGTYEGKAFEDGEVLGNWEMTVTNSQATGTYYSGGMTKSFSGNVSSSGVMNVSMNLGGGYSVTFNISISGAQVSGTWQDSDGYSGSISGTRTSQGGGGGTPQWTMVPISTPASHSESYDKDVICKSWEVVGLPLIFTICSYSNGGSGFSVVENTGTKDVSICWKLHYNTASPSVGCRSRLPVGEVAKSSCSPCGHANGGGSHFELTKYEEL